MNWDNHKDVMGAVFESSGKFQLASDRLKDDKYFLLHILMSDWYRVYQGRGEVAGNYRQTDCRYSTWDTILQYASERLKDEEDFMDHVTDLNLGNFVYASARLKGNKGFAIKMLQKDHYRNGMVL
ncbi:MAG: hypothetical protein Q8S01_05650, partial [Ignavibacteria bacterium]|nr:hypothetical protein [Ignavibacteria bacterium]